MSQEKPPNTMGDVINNQGIVTQGQHGNNTINNFGPQKLVFDTAVANDLISKLPVGKPIDVIGVGSKDDWNIVGQYVKYLKDKGLDVTFGVTQMNNPAPVAKITIGDTSKPRIEVLIAPSFL